MDDLVSLYRAYDHEQLAAGLLRARMSGSDCEIAAGLLVDGEAKALRIDGAGCISRAEQTSDRELLGCSVKALTGTLAMIAAKEGRLDFDARLTELVADVIATRRGEFHGVTVRHLLSHAHGIDASYVARLPLTRKGRIDLPTLCKLLCRAPRLFAAGELYSYSNTGSWLVAAFLECAYGCSFSELLTSKVLRPAGVDPGGGQRERDWCPALGGGLSLSVPELLRVLRWFLSERDLRSHAELRTSARPPGWSLESGAGAGWKCYGSGWFGHNTFPGRRALVMRVQIEHGIAVVVATRGTSASTAMTRIFGRLLPEYQDLRLPKVLCEPAAAVATLRCVGTYASGASRVCVTCADGGALQAEISTRVPGADCFTRRTTRLRAGTNACFLADPSAADLFQWIQFIPPEAQAYSHLWTGRGVLRRI